MSSMGWQLKSDMVYALSKELSALEYELNWQKNIGRAPEKKLQEIREAIENKKREIAVFTGSIQYSPQFEEEEEEPVEIKSYFDEEGRLCIDLGGDLTPEQEERKRREEEDMAKTYESIRELFREMGIKEEDLPHFGF